MTAIVVLGMHRSGTSCLAGMLAAAKLGSAGAAIRNWDNARGHFERLDLVRLDEAVLAHSDANYLAAPAQVRWTDELAAARDALLASTIDGQTPLLKDPRMLLVLPFWRASAIPWRAIGIVRHPLAVARSLAAWREMSLADGIALWLVHNRALAADRATHGTPIIDFDQPKARVVQALAELTGAEPAVLAAAYADELVHHDHADAPVIAGLDEAIALYRELARVDHGAEGVPIDVNSISPGGDDGTREATGFPRAELAAFDEQLRAGNRQEALEAVLAALAATRDPAAVLVPAYTALSRARAWDEIRALLDAAPPSDLVELLRGKRALAIGDPAALQHLENACAVAHPNFQARVLLPHALRKAGRPVDARIALEQVAADALYPHGSYATLAEWALLDGDREAAMSWMTRAIEAAPPRRRGRLRCRRAEWLRDAGDRAGARAELELAIVEDPGFPRSRELLASL